MGLSETERDANGRKSRRPEQRPVNETVCRLSCRLAATSIIFGSKKNRMSKSKGVKFDSDKSNSVGLVLAHTVIVTCRAHMLHVA